MFYTGSQFLFESSLRSAYWSTSRFMGPHLGICKETHSSASGLRLRTTDKCDLLVRRMETRFGDRAFSAGPKSWNSLSAAPRAANSIDSFKTVVPEAEQGCAWSSPFPSLIILRCFFWISNLSLRWLQQIQICLACVLLCTPIC